MHTKEGCTAGAAGTTWGLTNLEGLNYLILKLAPAGSKSDGDPLEMHAMENSGTQQTPRCRQMWKGQHDFRQTH